MPRSNFTNNYNRRRLVPYKNEEYSNAVKWRSKVGAYVQNGGSRELETAILMEDINTIQQLLENSDINASVYRDDRYNRTPLMLASFKGKATVVQWLIDHGANLDQQTTITYDDHPDAFSDNSGMSALLYACARGHLDVVRILLMNGADISQQNIPNGQTTLMLANSYANVLEYLIHAGANMDVRDSKGRTPLVYAVSGGNVNFIFPLPIGDGIPYPRPPSNYDSVKMLIYMGEDIHAKDLKGKSVLMYAVITDNFEAVKLLIEVGADVDDRDRSGKTVIQYVRQNIRQDIYRLLVDVKETIVQSGGRRLWN